MAIADKLNRYLREREIPFDVIAHAPTPSATRTAEAAHVPGNRIAKTVVLEDDTGFLAVVLPATRHVNLEAVNHSVKRQLHFATEDELKGVFSDCAPGAFPPIGSAYGVETVVDESLDHVPEVYFEAGDHEALVRLRAEHFQGLMRNAPHGHYSHA